MKQCLDGTTYHLGAGKGSYSHSYPVWSESGSRAFVEVMSEVLVNVFKHQVELHLVLRAIPRTNIKQPETTRVHLKSGSWNNKVIVVG